MIERPQETEGLGSRAVDALIVAALFAGKAALALWIIHPALP